MHVHMERFDAEATDDDGSCTFYDIYGTPGCKHPAQVPCDHPLV